MRSVASRYLCKPNIAVLSRDRFLCLLLFLVLPFLLGAKSETDDEHVICRDSFLEIVSPDVLGLDQCGRVAKMVMAAWNFDMQRMNWSQLTDMERPLKFQLLSEERMKADHPGLLGFAKNGGDLFVASTAVLYNSFANGTLAHELGHVQAYRAMGGSKLKAPHYFMEGQGLSLGRAYRDHLGLTDHKYDAGNARKIAKLTASEARLIVTTDVDYYRGDRDKIGTMEAFGVFFVEYLRVRKNVPDAVERMGCVFDSMGRGKTYEQAFKQAYGISVDQTISDITAFMEETQSNPTERLKGTHYDAGLL